MNTDSNLELSNNAFDMKNLNVIFVVCSEGTNRLDGLLNSIYNIEKKLLRR